MRDGNEAPYLDGNRFQTPNTLREIRSPYDQDSRLFQDLAQRQVVPVKVYRIDLSVAGEMKIDEPGYHFVQYGWVYSDPNTTPPTVGNKPVNTTTLVNVHINQQSAALPQPFPAKHARGYSGPFGQLYLTWDAQTSGGNPILCDFLIFKSYERPWIDGESAT